MATLLIDIDEFPNFEGQEAGRELELEMTAVVLKVVPPPQGGTGSSYVVLVPVRIDITQTT